MGVVDYTHRSKLLGNLGEVRRVEPAHRQASHVSLGGLGRGLGDLGDAFLGIAVGLRRQKEDRELAEDAIEIRRLWRQRMTNEKNGYMIRSGKTTEGLEKEAGAAFEEDWERVAHDRGRDHREKLKIMLGNHLTDLMSTVRMHEFKEMKSASLAAADGLVQEDSTDWAQGVQTEKGFQNAYNNFRHAMELHDEISPEAKREADRKWGEGKYADIVGTRLLCCQSPADFDALKAAVEKDPGSLVKDIPSLADHLKRNAQGESVSNDLKDRMLKAVSSAKRNWEIEREHERRQAVAEIEEGFVNRELELMDQDLPREKWADVYEEMGRDERLRELSPETALKYLETAKKMRGAVVKGTASSDEDELASRLTMMSFCEADGRYDERTLAAEQAALWRDFKTSLLAGKLKEGFARNFLGRMKTRLSEEERRAMREFYSSFGYHGDLTPEGDVGSKDRKDLAKTTFLAPVDETVPTTGEIEKGRRVKGAQLFELGDTFLRELKSLGPDAYRPEVMRTVIRDIKSRRMADDFNRNRDELAKAFLNIQRNFRATEVQRDRGRGETGNGNGGGKPGDGGDDDAGDKSPRKPARGGGSEG